MVRIGENVMGSMGSGDGVSALLLNLFNCSSFSFLQIS